MRALLENTYFNNKFVKHLVVVITIVASASPSSSTVALYFVSSPRSDEQGGVLPHGDERHSEFTMPLALARESCARSRRGGARLAVGIRNGPPHLVLLEM